MLSKSIEIVCTGETEEDIELALDEAVKAIKEGYLAGADENEFGSYSFDVSDESKDYQPLLEFSVYQTDTDGSERLAIVLDAKDKESAISKAKEMGYKNVVDACIKE